MPSVKLALKSAVRMLLACLLLAIVVGKSIHPM